MSGRVGYLVTGAALVFFAALFIILNERRWEGSDQQLSLFYERLEVDSCPEANAKLVKRSDGGLFLSDWRYETDITLPETCVVAALGAVSDRGFVEHKPGFFRKDFGQGYSEEVLYIAPGRIRWVRDKI